MSCPSLFWQYQPILPLVFAPTELVMGDVQRVFYFHIGTAWVGLLGFVIAAIAGISYLVTKYDVGPF